MTRGSWPVGDHVSLINKECVERECFEGQCLPVRKHGHLTVYTALTLFSKPCVGARGSHLPPAGCGGAPTAFNVGSSCALARQGTVPCWVH